MSRTHTGSEQTGRANEQGKQAGQTSRSYDFCFGEAQTFVKLHREIKVGEDCAFQLEVMQHNLTLEHAQVQLLSVKPLEVRPAHTGKKKKQ